MVHSTPAAPLARSTEANISSFDDDAANCSLRHLQALWSWAPRPTVPSGPSYPPVSSIPHTSAARLSEPDASPSPFPNEPVLPKTVQHDPLFQPKTVLYLAYGSNMCAATFLGMRGIRPLSQVNVSAPALDLTFDLPGMPYREPCFANTALRKLPIKPPPLDPPKLPPGIPDHPPFTTPPVPLSDVDSHTDHETGRRGPVWNKGLYGVVYEVTLDDYAKIVATEGGGASYHDILVPCYVLPARVGVPEKPPVPLPPKAFLAHTLYAPRLPDVPDSGDDDDSTRAAAQPHTNDKDEPKKPAPPYDKLPSWAKKLLLPVRRPSADYAQPSARYLGLLRDGAREHDLPGDYQAYLEALEPYTITTWRQKLGDLLFMGFWAPVLLLLMYGGRLVADDKGRSPPWLVVLMTVVFNLLWMSYDAVGKRIFGDGERTMPADDRGTKSRAGEGKRPGFGSDWRGKVEVADEEKMALLNASW